MTATPFLQLLALTRRFGPGPAAVDGLSLTIDEHEIVTLLGPSGCGKTTTLRMVAGFESPDRGRIELQGQDITGVSPQKRGFGMVFQHYALFPHLDVLKNVAFGLESSGLDREAIRKRVGRALDLVGLPGFENRSIGSLSGGQQQRIALARALAPEPRVLLLDEPLSNLDAALRERTRRELRTLVKEIGMTTLYVTHDQEEAFELSDRIAVMRDGRLEQVGPAERLYREPVTAFVAGFLGRVGRVEATVMAVREGEVDCRLAAGPVWTARYAGAAELREGSPVQLMVRPEALGFAGPNDSGALPGRIGARRFAGSFYACRVEVEGGSLEVHAEGVVEVGDRVKVRPLEPRAGLHAFAEPISAATKGLETDGR